LIEVEVNAVSFWVVFEQNRLLEKPKTEKGEDQKLQNKLPIFLYPLKKIND
jgi:hypothetical protein